MEPTLLWERLARNLAVPPKVAPTALLAPGVCLVGAVTVGERSSLWPGVVARADLNPIEIGAETNLQDGCILHVADAYPLRIGDGVSCGHRVLLHACAIGAHVLVGMGACVMDGAVIGPETIIGAQSLVTKAMEVPPRSLVVGSPARVVRTLSSAEVESIYTLAQKYVDVARYYRSNPPWPKAG
ncbi:MAG TPA: gamma carbonic anhydrase family protein [Chthoniobacterales bacterium]